MFVMTQMGVINGEKQLHRDFAVKALDEMLDTQRTLCHKLYNEGQFGLFEIAWSKVNRLINDITRIRLIK